MSDQPINPQNETSNLAQNQEVLERKKNKSKKKKNKVLRILLIILAVLLALGTAAAWAAYSTYKEGEAAIQAASQADDILTAADAVSYDEGRTIEYNGNTYTLNENMVSICIIGCDDDTDTESNEAPGQADVIMVLALNTDTGETSLINIPRDSMVEVGEFVGEAFLGIDSMQVCLAYSYGTSDEISSEYTSTAVSRILYNMPISYYYTLDLDGIIALNDAIGGVSLTPLQTVNNTDIVEGEDTVLYGSDALAYVQWRDTSVLTSSLDRQERQIQYIKAFTSQTLSAAQGDISLLLDLFNTASEYSTTNVGISEFAYLASSMVSSGTTSLEVTSLTGEMEQGDVYAEYYLDSTVTYETILDIYYTQVD